MEQKIVVANHRKKMLYCLYEETLLGKGGINTDKDKSLLKSALIDLYCNSIDCTIPDKTLATELSASMSYFNNTTQSRYDVTVTNMSGVTYVFSTTTPNYTIIPSGNTAQIIYTGTESYCSQNVVVTVVIQKPNSCSKVITLTIPKSCRTAAECNSYLSPLIVINSTGNPGNTGWSSSVTNIPGAAYSWSFTAPDTTWSMTTSGNTAQFIWSGTGLYCENPINISVTCFVDNCTFSRLQAIGVVC